MASEIRANTLKNRVGLGTVSFTNTGPVVSGIVTATGIELTGAIDANGDLDVDGHTNLDNVSIAGVTTFSSGMFIPDNQVIHLGNVAGTGDLQIYHDTSHSYVKDVGTGDLVLQTQGGHVRIKYGSHTMALFQPSGYSQLYFNNNVKLATTNTGVSVTGNISATGNLIPGGTLYLTDAIEHTDDSNTKIRFPAADTITAETAGSERLRIASDGGVGINTDKTRNTKNVSIAGVTRDYTNSGTDLVDAGGVILQPTISLPSTGQAYPGIFWSGNTVALGRARAGITGVAASNNDATDLVFLTKNSAGGHGLYPSDERLRITSGGNVLINGTTFYGTGTSGHVQIHDSTLVLSKVGTGTRNWRFVNNNVAAGNLGLQVSQSDNGSTTYGNVIEITKSGRVGINEGTPQQQLHVHDDTNYQGILINGSSAPRIAFARSTTTTGEWSVGVDGTNGNNFCINNSNDNSNRKFIISSTQISSLMNHSVSGNVILANAGSGIDFSATADGGTGTPSELLDDYEEGYFAPEVTNLTSGYGSGTFYNRQARYTKVGNMVTCWVHLQWWGNAVTSGADNTELSITGFPFEVDGVGYSGSCGGGLQSQSWRFSGTGFNNYNVGSDNVQPRINSNEQIRFGVFAHNSITGQVTQKSINGYSPNIEFVFTVRVTTYK